MLWWGCLAYLAVYRIFVEHFFTLSWQLILVELIFKDGMYFCVGATNMSVLDLIQMMYCQYCFIYAGIQTLVSWWDKCLSVGGGCVKF